MQSDNILSRGWRVVSHMEITCPAEAAQSMNGGGLVVCQCSGNISLVVDGDWDSGRS